MQGTLRTHIIIFADVVLLRGAEGHSNCKERKVI